MTSPLLAGRALVYSYGNTPALRGVSVEVGRGELLAVTGPSGSGKSTLMLCLAGIIVPDAGTVTFAGEQVNAASEAERSRLRRTRIGVLFQFGQIVPELSCAENVMLPLLPSGVRRRPARTAALNWMERFDVAELADQHPGEVSGGQQQRVAVARAMVTEPEVVFADEPTGALDQLAGEKVMTQLTRVARDSETAVVVITHDPRIAAFADREVVIRDGLLDDADPVEASQVASGTIR